jgi:predicted DNA-binding transcriptional regulator AlpA
MENRAIPVSSSSGSILLTPQVICRVLSISRRTLRNWISKKLFPEPLRIGHGGRLLRWHVDDLVDYLKATRGHPSAEAVLSEITKPAGEKTQGQ